MEADAKLVRALGDPQGTDPSAANADTAASHAAPSTAADTVPLDAVPAVPDMDTGKGDPDAGEQECPEPARDGDDPDEDGWGNGNIEENAGDRDNDEQPEDNDDDQVDFGEWTLADMLPERIPPNDDDLAFLLEHFPGRHYDNWMDAQRDERWRNMHSGQIALLRDALTNRNGDVANNVDGDGATPDDSKAPDSRVE